MNIPGRSSDFLADSTRYQDWRNARLRSYPRSVEEILVPVDSLRSMNIKQNEAIKKACMRSNMAI